MILDTIIAVLLGYALFKGFKNGFIISILSLISLFLGIYVSLHFSHFIKDWLASSTNSEGYTIGLVAFVLTFVGVLIGLHFLGKFLTSALSALALGLINKMAGALFEGIKLILILSVLIHIFQKINVHQIMISNDKLLESKMYQPILQISGFLFPLLQEGFDWAIDNSDKNTI